MHGKRTRETKYTKGTFRPKDKKKKKVTEHNLKNMKIDIYELYKQLELMSSALERKVDTTAHVAHVTFLIQL